MVLRLKKVNVHCIPKDGGGPTLALDRATLVYDSNMFKAFDREDNDLKMCITLSQIVRMHKGYVKSPNGKIVKGNTAITLKFPAFVGTHPTMEIVFKMDIEDHKEMHDIVRFDHLELDFNKHLT